MSHTMYCALATAVTVMPPSVSLAGSGPHVPAVCAVQSQTGSPTRPCPVVSGAVPIAGPLTRIFAMARAATSAGVGPLPWPGGGVLNHLVPTGIGPKPPPNGTRHHAL